MPHINYLITRTARRAIIWRAQGDSEGTNQVLLRSLNATSFPTRFEPAVCALSQDCVLHFPCGSFWLVLKLKQGGSGPVAADAGPQESPLHRTFTESQKQLKPFSCPLCTLNSNLQTLIPKALNPKPSSRVYDRAGKPQAAAWSSPRSSAAKARQHSPETNAEDSTHKGSLFYLGCGG